MLSQLTDLVLRHPRRLLWTALLLVVAGLVAGAVSTVTMTMGLGDYDDPASPSAQAQHEVLRATGTDPQQGYLVLLRTGSPIDPDAEPPTAVVRLEALLKARPEVRSVHTYASTGDSRMISATGRDTFVVASLTGFTGNAERDAVAALERDLDADPLLHGRTWLGGPTTANVQVSAISTIDLALAETIAFPILLVLLLFVFRGVVAAVVPLLGAGFTIAVALLGLGAVTSVMNLSVFALNLLLALGTGLAIDFSLLMISRFREELDRGLPVPGALRVTVSVAGRTVLFSALTVAAALAPLMLFPQRFLYSMGAAGVLTAAAAAAFALVVLPALLAVLGTRIDKWAPRRWRAAGTGRQRWYRFSWVVMRRPLVFGGVAALVLVVLGAPFAGITFTGVDAGVLPADASAGYVSRAIERDFPAAPATPIQLVVTAPDSAEPALTAYAAEVGRVPGVAAVSAPARLGGGLWAIQATPDAAPLSPQARASLTGIEELTAPFPVRATGQTAQFAAMQSSLGAHLPLALGLIVVTTLLILFAMTGSVLLPIKALVMNALSLSAAFGTLVFVFQDGHLEGALGFTSQGALESTSPIILFALAFGLSTDYTVFLLGRIKECHDSGLPTREAVAVALDKTGRIVTMAAVLLAVAIGALAISRLGFVKQLGVGTAVAVLVDATLVRAVLVPALMALMRDANWWAPAPLRWLHERLGLAGPKIANPPQLPEHRPTPAVR